MADAFTEWTVLPHGPWQELAENLWCVEGTLEGDMRGWPRTMTAVRRPDGTVVIHSPVALDEPSMERLEAWGRPTVLVVPNGSHRTDAYAYAQRYPGLKIYAPKNNRANVDKVVPTHGSYDDIPADSCVRAEHLEGVNGWEGVLQVRSSDGISLVFCDIVSWIPDLPEPAKSFVEPFGFVSPEPTLAQMAKDELVRDAKALRAHLTRLADTKDLVRVIPGHGRVIRDRPAEALRAIAATL